MKLWDSNVLNGQVQKVVETASGFIMHGHYYNKSNMVVKPFKLFPTLSSIYDLSLSKKLVLNSNFVHHFKTIGDTIVVDRYDPTITYVFTIDIRNNGHKMLKIRESSDSVDLLLSKDFGAIPTTYPMVSCYLGQDTTNLYYVITCSGFHDYFVKIDKISLTMTIVDDLSSYSWVTPLKENATHIYYGVKQGYGTNIIKRYNKSTAVIETLPVTARTSNIYFSTRYTLPITVSDAEMYTFAISHIQAANRFDIYRYKFDTTQSSLTSIMIEELCTINWNSTVTKLPVLASTANVHYEPFITTAPISGKKYLNIAVYEIQNSSTAANLPYYGIYTFLIDMPTNTLTFKSFTQPSVDYFRGALSVKGGNHLICATPGSTIFMIFNETTESFQVTQTIANLPYHIGLDQLDGIHLINSLTELDYYDLKVPVSNIYIKPETSNYAYDANGTGLTYCTIRCQNYTGDYIDTNLQLTITGPALFASNNSATIIAPISAAGTQVQIKVTGPGPINIQTGSIK